MKERFIPVNIPKFWGEEKDALLQCINTGWVSSEGPQVPLFEQEMAKVCNRRFGVACSSGTAALEIVFRSLDLRPGDEVILPDLCIISCIVGIVQVGATPVLVDSSPDDYNMNVKEVIKKITPKTRAILCVHLYEFPCDMDPILKACAGTPKIAVIEDAAEMLGQTYKGKPCGSFGHVSTFSFYPNKQVTTGEGGIVLCDDQALFEEAQKQRNIYTSPELRRFVHNKLGSNFRMTCLQAAVGSAQLKYLDAAVLRRREIGKLYTELLTGTPHISLPRTEDQHGNANIYWVYMIRVTHPNPKYDADFFRQELAARQVGTRPCFWPMYLQPVFTDEGSLYYQSHFKEYDNKNSLDHANKTFYIPTGLGMADDDIAAVAQRLRALCASLDN